MDVLVDFREALGPVRDQGQRPTCAAFAATAAHGCHIRPAVTLSPEWVYCKANDRFSRNLNGMTIPQLGQVIRLDGQVEEKLCPYHLVPRCPEWRPDPTLTGKYFAESKVVGSLYEIIRQAVESCLPVILGIGVTQAFLSGGNGHPKKIDFFPTPDGNSISGHAVVLCGSALSGGLNYLLVRNSWGPAWGDLGHCWLSEVAIKETYIGALLLERTTNDDI